MIMKGGRRWKTLKETVERLLPIATRLNEKGIALRFINSNCDSDPKWTNMDAYTAEQELELIKPSGSTNIGHALVTKIITPMLAEMKAKSTFDPILISIITDGEVCRGIPLTLYFRFRKQRLTN